MTGNLAGRTALGAIVLALLPTTALASSFQILEQSPALQGTSFAGTASAAQDASTVFFNPAAMTEFDGKAFALGGSVIMPEAEFNNNGSTNSTAALQPGGGPLSGSDATSDETGLVPSLYYITPMTNRVTFGLGVNAPFGLATSYDDGWVGRYHATDSELTLLNINPTFAYEATDSLSFGAGFNYQRIDATLESEVDSYVACLGGGGTAATCTAQHGGPGVRSSDSSSEIVGDDRDITIDLSMLFQVSDATRIGATFREGGKFTLEGQARFSKDDSCDPSATGPAAGFCSGALDALAGNITADVELPDVLTLSGTHMINDRWTLHGDVSWTEWSSIQQIDIVNTSNGANVSTLDLEYENTVRYAVGAEFDQPGPFTWRAGVAIDEAPQTDPALQTPRVPDEDRTWLSAGFNYAVADDVEIDFGFTHILVDDVNIDNTNANGKTLTGEFDASVNILALQGNWRF